MKLNYVSKVVVVYIYAKVLRQLKNLIWSVTEMNKILIIEDETSICLELAELLQNEGYEADYLKSFENALEDILNAKADLLLLDINIPRMNGEMLLREIRKKSDVPIIMVTSKTGEVDWGALYELWSR